MTPATITSLLAASKLKIAGVVDAPLPAPLEQGAQVLLLSPMRGFWTHFTSSDEYRDGKANPMDRWSTRVITDIAQTTGAEPVFPFGGPPYVPFFDLALATMRAWGSPIGMLVHGDDGLFTSFRGALLLPKAHEWPRSTVTSPCTDCPAPCQSACPVDALSADGYDVPRCAAHLNTAHGAPCLDGGCRARRACPVGQDQRSPAQNAFHMAAFHRNLIP